MSPEMRARTAFRAAWGEDPQLIARAPGRVNLIGEHTDYNDGFVLPCAIGFETVVAAGPTPDRHISAIATDYGDERDHIALDVPQSATGGWRDYLRGMVHELGTATPLTGTRLAIAGNVPPGSGLSSSAALEVAIGHALLAVAGQALTSDQLAKAAQRAENGFVGAACGIMDQLISARGLADHALLIDCRSLACTAVAMPADMQIMIVNSGIRHSHAGGEYNQRRAQCAAAARHYGVAALRDLDMAALDARMAGLDPLSLRRARHVVSENARTLAATEALSNGDLRAMGRLMAGSHQSMRDDFEITVPPIDDLVALIASVLSGDGGARMTGGGFGGCVVALVPAGAVDEVAAVVCARYRTPDGTPPVITLSTASAGASVTRLTAA